MELLGVNNTKLKAIKNYFPKLKIVARGNVLTINGEASEIGRMNLTEISRGNLRMC